MAQITPTGNLVVWNDFEQPHRPTRDYSGFGSFLFDREQYDSALQTLGATIAATEH